MSATCAFCGTKFLRIPLAVTVYKPPQFNPEETRYLHKLCAADYILELERKLADTQRNLEEYRVLVCKQIDSGKLNE